MNLNKEQFEAVNLMKQGYNVFITGGAGTGKSTVIREYVNQFCMNKNVVLAAPTGVAAQHIDGYTMHHIFNAPIGNLIGLEPRYSTELLDETDVLIIDEISMARIDLFEYCMKVLQLANRNRLGDGKDSIQLIVSGDFYQLPPVANDTDNMKLQDYYGPFIDRDRCFAFETRMWGKMNFKNVILKQTIRQKNNAFTECLNHIREDDKYSQDALEMIIDRAAKRPFSRGITVASTNRKVNVINDNQLSRLQTESAIYQPVVNGSLSPKELAEYPALRIYLQERVMMTANASSYANGSFGTVIGMDDDEIQVKLDTGTVVSVTRKVRYFPGDETTSLDETNSIAQFPLQPAYAVTYHKVQGLTLPYMNLDPYCFMPGQLYVGLSRVPDFDCLYLSKEIKKEYLMVADDVCLFYDFMQQEQATMPVVTKPTEYVYGYAG